MECFGFALLSAIVGYVVAHFFPTILIPSADDDSDVAELQPADDLTHSVPSQLVASPHSQDTDYVRFHYRDGRVRVKKFPVREIYDLMIYEGRRFKPQEWTPDGHIYREVG